MNNNKTNILVETSTKVDVHLAAIGQEVNNLLLSYENKIRLLESNFLKYHTLNSKGRRRYRRKCSFIDSTTGVLEMNNINIKRDLSFSEPVHRTIAGNIPKPVGDPKISTYVNKINDLKLEYSKFRSKVYKPVLMESGFLNLSKESSITSSLNNQTILPNEEKEIKEVESSLPLVLDISPNINDLNEPLSLEKGSVFNQYIPCSNTRIDYINHLVLNDLKALKELFKDKQITYSSLISSGLYLNLKRHYKCGLVPPEITVIRYNQLETLPPLFEEIIINIDKIKKFILGIDQELIYETQYWVHDGMSPVFEDEDLRTVTLTALRGVHHSLEERYLSYEKVWVNKRPGSHYMTFYLMNLFKILIEFRFSKDFNKIRLKNFHYW